MLYLDTKKSKKGMKALYFQQNIRIISFCMKIIMKATKVCGRSSSNRTLFYDRWFIRVKKSVGVTFRGSRLLWACENKSQGILPSYFGKINERVSGRVS